MIEIYKQTTRRTRGLYCVLHHRKARPIVASFCLGDCIELREAGRRKRWTVAIDDVFRYAIRCQVEAERRKKLEARRAAA